MSGGAVALVQLPFPSQADPREEIKSYYDTYFRLYAELFPGYRVSEGDLWEAPLWVAHLDGALGRDDTQFIDLSRSSFDADACAASIVLQAREGETLFFSPLAQNFQLASDVSSRLRTIGYQTVVGGNMASLATTAQFDVVVDGVVGADIGRVIASALGKQTEQQIRFARKLGRAVEPIFYRPRYRLLSAFGKRAPMLRLNGSHGCLYGCTFCGDAWSKQLHVVQRDLLAEEAAELRQMFPATDTIYIGDKTFGQSEDAVQNLKYAIDPRWKWRLVVQTHASVVDERLVQQMVDLGVVACEIGFETADTPILRNLKKGADELRVRSAIKTLYAAGIKVILNVLGGLPHSTRASAVHTMRFLSETSDSVYLYNLYNFVPYPKTPLFPVLKDRIVDWNFANWREDMPVVFTPFEQTTAELWEDFLAITSHAHNLTRGRV